MAYSINVVLFAVLPTQQLTGSGRFGFPTTFDNLLFSTWVCLGSSSRVIGIADIIPFFGITITNTTVTVALQRSQSHPALNHNFTGVPIHNVLSNVLISVQLSTNTLQVYVNDAPITGSLTWTGSGMFNLSSGLNNWDISAAGAASPGSGVGDLYINNPTTFYDLSIVANRRKFISALLTPVDLLTDGSGPTGSQPPIFLTVRGADPANDFANNNGSGGSFTLSNGPLGFQTPGTCVVPNAVLNCDAGEMYFTNPASFFDLSNSANRQKFHSAAGAPVSLGPTGALPTGIQPLVFLSRQGGPPVDFATNVGSAGAFTINGGTLNDAGIIS